MRLFDYTEMFGNDSGEDENQEVLNSYFVNLPEYKKFSDDAAPLCIVRARKGMGKSALISNTEFQLKKSENNIVIRTTGNELLGLGEFIGKNSAYLENQWKQIICKRICLEIGKRINFAFSDSSMTMVEASELEGYKDRNLVSALTDRVGGLVKAAIGKSDSGGIEINSASRVKSNIKNPIEELRRFQERKDLLVWFLIDDIDAKYKDDDAHQELVGAFFSALRSLAFGVKGLRLRASVRTDVWYNLRRMEDQDKIRQYVVDIQWKDDTLRNILAKKILAYMQRESDDGRYTNWNEIVNYHQIMGEVFARQFSWGSQKEEPFTPIKILAGARPRWMGQLCRLAGLRKRSAFIGMSELTNVMEHFGKEKMGDLLKEHSHQFTDLEKLIDSFRSGKREYNRYSFIQQIQKHYIDKIKATPDVNGYPYIDTDQLGEFLFQIEFISGQRQGDRKYLLYQDDPSLFSHEENRDNKISWIISASYRNYLHIK